jgi:hypothetical protein
MMTIIGSATAATGASIAMSAAIQSPLCLIALAVIALVVVVLVQGKWTRVDSWFAAVFASAVMAMVIDHYVNQIN